MPRTGWSAKHQSCRTINPMWINSWLTTAKAERLQGAGADELSHIGMMLLSDQRERERPQYLRTAADAVSLLGDALGRSEREQLHIAHLAADGRLIAITQHSGVHDAVPLAPSTIARDALLRRTRRLLIAHNHPSGDATPSMVDRFATRRLAELFRLLDIELVDHLIFAGREVTSFRQSGLI